jgi:hypothetical protein
LLRVFVLVRTFLNLIGFGMTASRRRLGWSQRPTRRVVMTNLALIGQTKKGKGKGPIKGKGKGEGKSEESTSQPEKKELSKIKCFICHKHDHYASQFSKKGKYGCNKIIR